MCQPLLSDGMTVPNRVGLSESRISFVLKLSKLWSGSESPWPPVTVPPLPVSPNLPEVVFCCSMMSSALVGVTGTSTALYSSLRRSSRSLYMCARISRFRPKSCASCHSLRSTSSSLIVVMSVLPMFSLVDILAKFSQNEYAQFNVYHFGFVSLRQVHYYSSYAHFTSTTLLVTSENSKALKKLYFFVLLGDRGA
uniref:(northern house mosquito) hypothetical protein n=1 Tax=Culex pipiens TaxID=7175 RepID=A0A8D8NGW4_CULPI